MLNLLSKSETDRPPQYICRSMTYPETLDYLYYKLPMFGRMGSAAYKKDLTNTIALCQQLGNPQHLFKSIHIAGTNGKGSVSHMLAAVLQAAGYKTGLYTSPHLYDFRERIKLNGEMIPEETVVDFVERIRPVIEEMEPSFFEITVAMAFDFFAAQKVDVAVIEVGLGGRLDSTNVILPQLSVITNIGWDHMNLLGNSLEEIAAEKAGIIKPGTPLVVGETLAETKPVFQRMAKEMKAPVYWAEEHLQMRSYQLQEASLTAQYKRREDTEIKVTTDLPGLYQVHNLRTVLTAVDALKESGWRLPEEVVLQALVEVKKRTGFGGRWEVIHQQPTVVLDVAHNKEGLEKMLEHVQALTFRRLHIVIGMVKDKEVETILRLLPPTATYYFTQATIPRALPAPDLKQKATECGLQGVAFANVNVALKNTLSQAKPDDLVVVCGSIFLVAEVDKTQYVS